MNEERISRINEAKELFDKLYDFFRRCFSPSGSTCMYLVNSTQNMHYAATGLNAMLDFPRFFGIT